MDASKPFIQNFGICHFYEKDGKKEREIYKLPFFPDRIAQWAVLQVIEPQLLAYFTDDTYSAIPNKGIHAAYKKLRVGG